MILVLGNFAGVFSNLCKFLVWSIVLKKEDTLLFYYTNKGYNNDNHRILPYTSYEKDRNRIIFYKYFKMPEGHTLDSFLSMDDFEMNYPVVKEEVLPHCIRSYKNGFLFSLADAYKDSKFPDIRKLFHEHLQFRLPFTDSMKEFFQRDLQRIGTLKAEGKKILAVFLRSTCHFRHYNTSKVFHEIEEVMKDYDYILPITQIGPFFQKTYDLFGEKCILLKERVYLSEDKDWIEKTHTDEEFEVEVRNVIADVYLASQCSFLMGGSSNMFMGALFFNPDIPFKLFHELEEKNGG